MTRNTPRSAPTRITRQPQPHDSSAEEHAPGVAKPQAMRTAIALFLLLASCVGQDAPPPNATQGNVATDAPAATEAGAQDDATTGNADQTAPDVGTGKNCAEVTPGQTVCVQASDPGFDPVAQGAGTVPLPPGGIPASAELSHTGLTPPNQGTCGACVAFAVRNGMGLLGIAEKGIFYDFSAPHIWNIAGYGAADCLNGSFIGTVVTQNASKSSFVVLDPTWHYDASNPEPSLNNVPTSQALFDAGVAFIQSAVGIDIHSTTDVKAAIAQGWPAIIAVPVYWEAGWSPVKPEIDDPPPNATFAGYHAIAVVGYDDATQRMKFINSWGNTWGPSADGTGYLTYQMVEHSSNGGMALKRLAHKADCPINYCGAAGSTTGHHCNGTGAGSTALTCGVVLGCPAVTSIEWCSTGCEQGVCTSCIDGIQNQGETGVDCGGPCAPCGGSCTDGQKNGGETGVDCGGPVCEACSSTCNDLVQDGDEKGVDCGGSCPLPCPPTCSDGVLNQGEEQVDCGGPWCPACAATCTDGKWNQGESGVDCGGPCPPCTPTCSDSIMNQGETGVDCGGPCPPCGQPTCADGTQNQGESGVDCGGPCPPCACSPTIHAVFPTTALIGVNTVFTANGACIPSTAVAELSGCATMTAQSVTPGALVFGCTPEGQPGTHGGVIRSAPGAAAIYAFNVLFGANPPPTPGNVAVQYDASAKWNWISWSAVPGATSYSVFWGTAPGVDTGAMKMATQDTAYSHTGVVPGHTYYYRVAAENAGGQSELSSEVSVYVSIAAPPTPANLAVVYDASNQWNMITWSQSPGASTYNVYWGTSSNVTTSSMKMSTSSTSYSHTGVGAGYTYYYRVSAVNGGGESALSNTVSASVPAALPSTPTGVNASYDSVAKYNLIKWNAVAGATEYDVYWSTVAGVSTASMMLTPTTNVEYGHSGVVSGSRYYYRVAARNSVGQGALSTEVSVLVP